MPDPERVPIEREDPEELKSDELVEELPGGEAMSLLNLNLAAL